MFTKFYRILFRPLDNCRYTISTMEVGIGSYAVNVDGRNIIVVVPYFWVAESHGPYTGNRIIQKQFPLSVLCYLGFNNGMADIAPWHSIVQALVVPGATVKPQYLF